ncbi:MAG: VanW family protein [Lachnospiraceae bacterium]
MGQQVHRGSQNRGSQSRGRNGQNSQSSQNSQGRRRRTLAQRARLRRRKRRILIGLIFSCVVLVLGIFNMILHKAVSKYPDDVICKNIFIGAVDVSGMSKKEAKAAVEKQLAADRALTVSIQTESGTAEGTLEELGLKYKGVNKAVDKAMDYGKKGSLFSRYWKLRRASRRGVVIEEKLAIDKKAGAEVLVTRTDSLTDRAKNASITQDGSGFKIEKEQEGETVNIEDSLVKIEEHLNDSWDHKTFSVTADVVKEKPTVTASDLESIQDELGAFSTDAGSGERIQNLKTGVEKLSNIVLMPGEVLSVEDRTKPYTPENGYVMGGSYEGGRVVETYGGGLCQVSTTLYNAVIYAELEIEERYPHSMIVDYVKPSRDAAVAEGYLDFKFKNNYDTPIYIAGGIDEANQLYFKIYGKDTREEGRTVEYESEIISTEEPGVTYEANSELPLGTIQAVSSAHMGTDAMLWKVVYQNGEEVSREMFNSSSYQAADTIYAVGIMSDNPDAVALVQNAIATQDEAQIYAAIGAAQ